MVVDQYAVPTYKEINPAVFTIVSFPFLFGVMYGDIGHGSVLLLFALLLMTFGGQIAEKVEALKDIYEFRYMLFLMAFFSASAVSTRRYSDFFSDLNFSLLNLFCRSDTL